MRVKAKKQKKKHRITSKTYRDRDYYAGIFMQAILPTELLKLDPSASANPDTVIKVIVNSYYQSCKEADKFLASIGKTK